MTAHLMLVWDYDTAIGQVNASYPYRFDEQKLFEEIENVEKILELAHAHAAPMTFACVGFAAEPGVFPYHVPEQIQKIAHAGHEIASHSWKHEWFPFLEREQIKRSLDRSKYALETCLSETIKVNGFVPPFSRPMSWYSHGAFSLGDRAWGLGHPGANLDTLLPLVRAAGYDWCRVVYLTPLQRLKRKVRPALGSPWPVFQNVVCVPHHYTGFDEEAQSLLAEVVAKAAPLVIVGHPSGLSRSHAENLEHLKRFLEMAATYQSKKQLEICTVNRYLVSSRHKNER